MPKCDHSEIEVSGKIYEDNYLVEYTETCNECGKRWIWSYGYKEEDGYDSTKKYEK